MTTRDTTRHQAAESQTATKKQRDKDRILAALKSHPSGLTDEEIQRTAHVVGNTERPRRKELEEAGLIENRRGPDGKTITRKTDSGRAAVVWFVAGPRTERQSHFW